MIVASSFLVSFLLALAMVILAKRYPALVDVRSGIQNINTNLVPRLGGFGLILATGVISVWYEEIFLQKFLLICLPIIIIGAFEDVASGVNAWVRLIVLLAVAWLISWYFEVKFDYFGIYFLDVFFRTSHFWYLVITILILAGFANAFNIIDGFNGLMLGHTMTSLVVIWYVGAKINVNLEYLEVVSSFVGLVGGLLCINYPRGLIFSGDLGAYFLGLTVSFLVIWLIKTNDIVEPTFLFVLLFYPGFELLFSFIRKPLEKKSPLKPDYMHLHFLIFRALKEKFIFHKDLYYNILTSFLLYVAFLPIYLVSAMFFYDRVIMLTVFFIYVAGYLGIYFTLRGRVK